MTSDLDTYRAAHLLIKRHGEDAPVEAAMRADELMEAGDMEGVAVWKRIVKAIVIMHLTKVGTTVRF